MSAQALPKRASFQTSPLFLAVASIALGLVCFLLLSESASAHGYIESPASRAYLCKEQKNTGCGAIVYEPQSLEAVGNFPANGPADGQITGAGIFKELYEQTSSIWTKVAITGGKHTFTWKLTANHVSDNWRYYITKKDWDPNKPLTRDALESEPFCYIDYTNAKPPMTVSHDCNIPTDRSGYHLILGVWEVGDTVNAFYNVIDVNLINDGSVQPPPTEPSGLVSALQTVKSIVLSWLPSSSASGIKQYDIYRDGVLCGSTTHTTFTDDNLESDRSYTYTIKAVDNKDQVSSSSAPLTVRTLKEEENNGGGDGGNNGGDNGGDNDNGGGESGGNGSTLPEWSAQTIYVRGDKVQYGGHEYEAQYWTQNNNPDASSAWKLLSNVVLEWNSGKAYQGGDRVSYNGKIYTASWWTQGEKPDASVVWKENK